MTANGSDETARRLRALLGDLIRSRRADGVILAVLTALITPLLLVASILIATLLAFGGRTLEIVANGRAAVWATLFSLGVMFGVALYAPVPRWGTADRRFILWALLPWVAMAALVWGAGWPTRTAGWLWPPFVALGLLTLALLGRAYEPREDYYLGWFGGYMDDPFTLRDDVDRLHARLGFMVVLPMLLLGAWADLMGSVWLLHPPEDADLAGATELMLAMDLRDRAAIRDALTLRGARDSGRAARLLGHLGLIERHRDGPLLSARALDLIASARDEALRGA